jgi:hypothetical protein
MQVNVPRRILKREEFFKLEFLRQNSFPFSWWQSLVEGFKGILTSYPFKALNDVVFNLSS